MAMGISVETSSRVQFVDITAKVRAAVKERGVQEGLCHVYVPHTTAAVTVNEGADPDVTRDIIDQMESVAPQGGRYRHREGNADSHVRSTVVGVSAIVPVRGGDLALGTWQSVFFCEFDGPRRRKVLVTVVAAA
jgi:secondary thiamine-phosphate synthase enzyme